ncbi:hypothetical protein KPL70_008773 [Citrus sinensis]|uniref:uncharacterized protein LOC102619684 n=1 Tax=Citrus sinensis TaxID=2711 RepID=UPI0021A1EEFC|nr:uncharacterized protein LOC102619684 [Citrus sinensis]KAH9727716.1 hypothetical protein KPL70_008773 [Citrus sinensis]
MGRFSCETESWVDSSEAIMEEETHDLNQEPQFLTITRSGFDEEESEELLKNENKKKKKNQVLLEGYVETDSEDDLKRTKSLTDEDLDELKGCLDLGFGFSYDEIPELCNTLPALELCYSMSQKFMDEHQSQKSPESHGNSPLSTDPVSSPIANWKISSPGDHPEDVKARLKYWAQAVACTVRLCS